MNRNVKTALRRIGKEESGQALIMVAFMMVVLLGFLGLIFDVGHVYFVYWELQNSTDAAALAGATALPASTATTLATSYSSVSGNLNAYGNLPSVSMVTGYPKVRCLTTYTAQGIACASPAGGNSIQVKQQSIVPMYFATVFGISSMTVTASATAVSRGSTATPYNVAFVVDTTQSMNSIDSDINCNASRISCSLAGVQIMLQGLSPCANQSSCGTPTNGIVPNTVDAVSIFTFPGVTSSTLANDYNCSGTAPTSAPYSYPTLPNYQIVPFSSDYRSSSTASTLTTTSHLVTAAGAKSGCTGMQAEGGQGTYYAGVIYAAQAALVARQTANPGTDNVLIILSDGDANASASRMPGASTTSGVYPSTRNQCQQAVTAAKAATAAGTTVYSVAYGSATSGCSTDSPSITPCQVMEQMASSSATFFSDYNATGGGSCVSASQPTTSLNQIFNQIVSNLTVARLVPDNTP